MCVPTNLRIAQVRCQLSANPSLSFSSTTSSDIDLHCLIRELWDVSEADNVAISVSMSKPLIERAWCNQLCIIIYASEPCSQQACVRCIVHGMHPLYGGKRDHEAATCWSSWVAPTWESVQLRV